MRWHAHPGETAWCVSHDRTHTCTDARPCRRRGHQPRRAREQANYGEQEVQHLSVATSDPISTNTAPKIHTLSGTAL